MMPENISEKVTGYILLLAGLGLIVYSAFNVYSVFSKRQKPIDLFSFAPIYLDYGKMVGDASKDKDFKQELVSANLLNEPTNYLAHLMLMGFMVSVGGKVAQIGTMLIRPIKVKLKEEKEIKIPESRPV